MITDENDNIIKQIVLTENETEDEFIFETISNWMSEKKQITVSKQELVSAIVLQRNLVRCKDCDNRECDGRAGTIVCGITGESHSRLWYCADGERRNDAH